MGATFVEIGHIYSPINSALVDALNSRTVEVIEDAIAEPGNVSHEALDELGRSWVEIVENGHDSVEVGSGQLNAWIVFRDIIWELLNPDDRYSATERLSLVLTDTPVNLGGSDLLCDSSDYRIPIDESLLGVQLMQRCITGIVAAGQQYASGLKCSPRQLHGRIYRN